MSSVGRWRTLKNTYSAGSVVKEPLQNGDLGMPNGAVHDLSDGGTTAVSRPLRLGLQITCLGYRALSGNKEI